MAIDASGTQIIPVNTRNNAITTTKSTLIRSISTPPSCIADLHGPSRRDHVFSPCAAISFPDQFTRRIALYRRTNVYTNGDYPARGVEIRIRLIATVAHAPTNVAVVVSANIPFFFLSVIGIADGFAGGASL